MQQTGLKSLGEPLRPTLNQFLSQRWIYEQRYLLNTNNVPVDYVNDLNLQAFRLFDLCPEQYTGVVGSKLCEWLDEYCILEAHLYDHIVPPGYTIPAKFVADDQPWKILILTYQPYNINTTPHKIFTHPKTVARCYAEKDDQYDAPKSFYLENIEIGWIGYQDVEECTLVHHIQMRGAYKEFMSNNDQLWMYRYLIRMFVQFLPSSNLNQLYVPDATIMTTFANAHSTPYSQKTLGRSNFEKVSYQKFANACYNAAERVLFPPGDMWKYKT